MSTPKDQGFTAYSDATIFNHGRIERGCLSFSSEIDDDEMGYTSEKHYKLTSDNTAKLFELITLEEFIELWNEKHTSGVEDFLKDNGIEFKYGYY